MALSPMGIWYVFHFMYWPNVMRTLFLPKPKIQTGLWTMYMKSVTIAFFINKLYERF